MDKVAADLPSALSHTLEAAVLAALLAAVDSDLAASAAVLAFAALFFAEVASDFALSAEDFAEFAAFTAWPMDTPVNLPDVVLVSLNL